MMSGPQGAVGVYGYNNIESAERKMEIPGVKVLGDPFMPSSRAGLGVRREETAAAQLMALAGWDPVEGRTENREEMERRFYRQRKSV